MPSDPSPTVVLSLAEVRQWIHDLRNSMHALHLGLELLPKVRGDDAHFQRVWDLMVEEHGRAMTTLEDFSQTAPRPPAANSEQQ